ncbi:unnamed protein product [Dibothriocephalus latus]|uniref:Uncharacterized protein n=1 Tax=Dibothriocephalus latus TaxID=60516 RepID=A0A3P7M386_DIBLA|nr:unnamed protein product [Dibothriocephalus latus]
MAVLLGNRFSEWRYDTGYLRFPALSTITMAAPPLLLSTIASTDQDAVIAWDPVAGNPIVSFSGDTPARSTLTATKALVVCAVAKKPVLQMWSFQSSAAHKRLTTKGVVNALAFTHDDSILFLAIEKSIYAYQFFDALTGQLSSTVLSNSPPLSSICSAPYSNHVFCGTENGILHTIWIKNPQDLQSLELSFRRCFAESG